MSTQKRECTESNSWAGFLPRRFLSISEALHNLNGTLLFFLANSRVRVLQVDSVNYRQHRKQTDFKTCYPMVYK